MKIIDRYILREFLFPLMYCLFAFFILYIVADLFQNLDDFIEMRMSLVNVLLYYFFFLPNVLVLTVPFAVMLGLLYELGNLGRHNELTAMRASGVKLVRIVMPLVVSAFLLSLCILAVSEFILPISNYQSEKIRSMTEEKSIHLKEIIIKDVAFYSLEKKYIIVLQT